ncbi:MAG: NADase-type glycan-binding domain-containing protein [Myxococcota bacterium]
MTMRNSLPALFLVPALAAATGVRGSSAPAASAWQSALSSSFLILDVTEGDLDGDGRPETVLCYQDNPDNPYSAGGISILGDRGRGQEPLFHVRLDKTWCEKVRVRGAQLGILLKSSTLDKTKGQLVWTYGKEIHWRGERGHPLADARIMASSTHPGGQYPVSALSDGDLRTSWAEGGSGTGIGEKVVIKLSRPMDIAYIAIFSGRGDGGREFLASNRVHRGSVEVRSAADLGDELASLDFTDLGIDVGGDRVEFTLENQPQVTYVRIDRYGVEELELRLDSVYLGQKYDDTHIAELEIVPRLSLSETLDRARPLSAKRSTEQADGERPVDPEVEARNRAALDSLDAAGRGLELSADDL